MNKQKYVLFDFDGVLVNTEPIYDIFWNEAGVRYGLGENFASKIKGTTMPYVMETYFSDASEETKASVLQESNEFEKQMDFPTIDGALDFVYNVKKEGFKVGLVTSSQDFKMERAFSILSLNNVFDTIVTADRITKGKPDPMCYLLAANDWNAKPENCIVFEDSFAGIKAATLAGMRVIGVSSTIPAEELSDKVHDVIPDFSSVSVSQLLEWFK
ncbi:MAG: HAD family phosphatase [Parabacteroides sp.]|jgi:HAD superfamily hydrolase (TIGR01509 family)|uniref:Haloacid dehalogenase superfamily, subfamily IA, variant 3 with third motif having DD or ED n=3 Tax=root TaxID=1 RepID=A0A1T5C2U4_9BACT|nr:MULTISPECIES: HAD family phosphatase [Bacteroidales]MBP7919413.1 HAD family phosphatase [Parabacteroides sp.]MDT3368146.1 HAD family phosphatase [Bacteroidota bacterium]OCW92701.1 haloacid dehalogenase [Macellibacteroides sp. HH-ZS]HAD00714.1 HAD family phosphatase [Porphyromonadaceae bacterium]MBP7954857.1 HAD family phosphatase [Parabacteroides sp.]